MPLQEGKPMAETKTPAVAVVDTTSPAALSNAMKIEQAAISADLEANPRDETQPGGRILIDGVLCNAWGHAIHKDGSLVNPQDALKQMI